MPSFCRANKTHIARQGLGRDNFGHNCAHLAVMLLKQQTTHQENEGIWQTCLVNSQMNVGMLQMSSKLSSSRNAHVATMQEVPSKIGSREMLMWLPCMNVNKIPRNQERHAVDTQQTEVQEKMPMGLLCMRCLAKLDQEKCSCGYHVSM